MSTKRLQQAWIWKFLRPLPHPFKSYLKSSHTVTLKTAFAPNFEASSSLGVVYNVNCESSNIVKAGTEISAVMFFNGTLFWKCAMAKKVRLANLERKNVVFWNIREISKKTGRSKRQKITLTGGLHVCYEVSTEYLSLKHTKKYFYSLNSPNRCWPV